MKTITQVVVPAKTLKPKETIRIGDLEFQNQGEHPVYCGFFSLMEDPVPIVNVTDDEE